MILQTNPCFPWFFLWSIFNINKNKKTLITCREIGNCRAYEISTFLMTIPIGSTLASSEISSFLRCSNRLTPIAHLTILISVVAIFFSFLTDIGHVSQPYTVESCLETPTLRNRCRWWHLVASPRPWSSRSRAPRPSPWRRRRWCSSCNRTPPAVDRPYSAGNLSSSGENQPWSEGNQPYSAAVACRCNSAASQCRSGGSHSKSEGSQSKWLAVSQSKWLAVSQSKWLAGTQSRWLAGSQCRWSGGNRSSSLARPSRWSEGSQCRL